LVHGWPAAIFATQTSDAPPVPVPQKLPSGQATVIEEQSAPIATVVGGAVQVPEQQLVPAVQADVSQLPETHSSSAKQAAPAPSVPWIA
jgi:hypothetical protein